MQVETLATRLDTPWALDFTPDGRMFITERPGRARIFKDGALAPEPWANLDTVEQENQESGLLGLAVDPDFARNGYVYVAYTYRTREGERKNRLVRMREDAAPGKGALDKVLMEGVKAGAYHDGGRVKVGPDGKLYWTMGETYDPPLAQDLNCPNGKILRLERDGGVPSDNPFLNSPIYSYGNRNPQGLAWQPGTGQLYSTEHGPSGTQGPGRDEVNLIEAGRNYGWPIITGDQTHDGMESPVIQSGYEVTWAPSGCAFVTRGPWDGSFVFVGLRGQALYRLTLDPVNPRKPAGFETHLHKQYGRLRDVVEGPDGALYLLTSNRDGRGRPTAEDDRLLRVTV